MPWRVEEGASGWTLRRHLEDELGADGANFASAAGVGMGLAASENALCCWATWGSPLDSRVLLMAIRVAVDPLRRPTATALSTRTWRGRPSTMSWNFALLVYVLVDPLAGLLRLRRSPAVPADLDDWTGRDAGTGEVARGA